MPDGEITFSIPGHADVTLPVANGYRPDINAGQTVETSPQGAIRATQQHARISTLNIPFVRLTRMQILALESIIEWANYSEFGIAITDPYDTYQDMHYISGLKARWSRGDEYACTLKFQQSTTEAYPLDKNLNADSLFTDSAPWTTTTQPYDRFDFNDNSDATLVTDQIPRMLKVTDASDGYNRAILNTKFPVTDYVHEVSCAVWRDGQGDNSRLFCQFFDGDTAIVGNVGSQTGWAERATYHYWSTITGTTVRVGSASKTLALGRWNFYTFTFGRTGGQIPASADTFKIGLESGSGGGVNISYWYFSLYETRILL